MTGLAVATLVHDTPASLWSAPDGTAVATFRVA